MKFHRVTALLLKYVYTTKNSLDRLFDLFYWPTLDLVLWGFASLFISDLSDVNILSMLLGGVILWIFLWRTSVDLGIFILEDFWQHNVYNLFASPVKSSEVALSVVIFSLFRALTSFVFVSLFGFLLYSFNILEVGGLSVGLLVMMLVMFGWVLGMLIGGFIFRFGSRIQVVAWSVTWIIQPFSCVFYPLSALPEWAQKIAIVLPTTHIFEAFRAIINGSGIPWNGILYSFSAIFVLLFLAGFYFYKSIERARQTGLLTRYE